MDAYVHSPYFFKLASSEVGLFYIDGLVLAHWSYCSLAQSHRYDATSTGEVILGVIIYAKQLTRN